MDAEKFDLKVMLLLCIVGFVLIFMARIYWVLVRRKILKKKKVEKLVKTMVVMGSGGHTKEMLMLMTGLSNCYYPRIYIIADTDNMSDEKIRDFEHENNYEVEKIPRSREVHQSWSSTVITTFKSLIYSFPLVYRHKPQLILCNGPGTCIPICLAALVLKYTYQLILLILTCRENAQNKLASAIFIVLNWSVRIKNQINLDIPVLGLQTVSVIYIESLCRVETLSLSAKILYYFADQVLVQWKQLVNKYPRTLYLGRLV